jgi:putative transposase
MPYEYRKLSLRERERIAEARKQRGYPLHAPPHPFREQGTYLITAANFEHKELLHSPERRTEFQEILLNGFHEINADTIGWAILSNHYHILVTVESLALVSKLIKLVHGRTSHDWNLQDGLTGKRKVWYRFSDRRMRDEKQLNQTLNYIHFNPVKHGYVTEIFDWQWSSLFLYENEMGNEWLRTHWKNYMPTEDFGKDWDI